MSETDTSASSAVTKKLPMILVAEDSIPNSRIMCHLVTKLGFDAIAAMDGKLAWEFLTGEACEVSRLVAILSDMMMPNMDGLELLEKVRGHELLKDKPFIFVTGVVDQGHIKEAVKLKVNGYLLKPITTDALIDKLKLIIPDNLNIPINLKMNMSEKKQNR